MSTIPLIEDEAKLAKIYAEIEQRVSAAQAARPVWPCKMGCDACCRRLAHPPKVTAVEWHHLKKGIQALPKHVFDEVEQKILALADRDEEKRPFVTCPLLDEEIGACRVYAHRPAACRMYGFYVSRYNNQWCQQIEDLFQDGALDGVMLGNVSSMNRYIQNKFGEIRSIVFWWNEADKKP